MPDYHLRWPYETENVYLCSETSVTSKYLTKNQIAMKKIIVSLMASLILVALLFSLSCRKDEQNNPETGLLTFKTYNPFFNDGAKGMDGIKRLLYNPPLLGDTTETETTELLICFIDVWVSQEEVKTGVKDTFNWVKISSVSNMDHKFFHKYAFHDVEIPAGEYKSIKIHVKNIFWRYAQLIADPTIAYELFETMGIASDSCDVNDSTTKYNYFGPMGNHSLDTITNSFGLPMPGEKVDGFIIEPGKKAVVTWRLGAGVDKKCITYLVDKNNNLEWDCGIDDMHIWCPPEVIYMWDFVVEYE